MESMEEAGRGEEEGEEEEEESPKSWSPKRKRWPWLLKDWGFCAAGFGRKEFAVEKSRFG
jgi:hypothetical protein